MRIWTFWLAGGCNTSEKYSSNWIISPKLGIKIANIWNHHLDMVTKIKQIQNFEVLQFHKVENGQFD